MSRDKPYAEPVTISFPNSACSQAGVIAGTFIRAMAFSQACNCRATLKIQKWTVTGHPERRMYRTLLAWGYAGNRNWFVNAKRATKLLVKGSWSMRANEWLALSQVLPIEIRALAAPYEGLRKRQRAPPLTPPKFLGIKGSRSRQ
jgi:hypothetical protein